MTLPSLQIDQILCPTDFSVFSARALGHALALAQQFKARLKVVHVLPCALNTGGTTFLATRIQPSPEQLQHAELDMRRFIEPATAQGIRVATEIRIGQPWREILTVARDLPADLVALSTHGRTGIEPFALGSVTSKLLGQLPCLTLTVGQEEAKAGQPAGSLKSILCATDFSPSAAEAVTFSIALADRCRARITLLYVVDALVDSEEQLGYSVPETAPLRHALAEHARPRLLAAAPDVLTCGVEVEKRLSTGRAHERILDLAARQSADLIVLGTRGHGRLSRTFFGSTSEHVVRQATCPVVTVPLRATVRVLGHELSLAAVHSSAS